MITLYRHNRLVPQSQALYPTSKLTGFRWWTIQMKIIHHQSDYPLLARDKNLSKIWIMSSPVKSAWIPNIMKVQKSLTIFNTKTAWLILEKILITSKNINNQSICRTLWNFKKTFWRHKNLITPKKFSFKIWRLYLLISVKDRLSKLIKNKTVSPFST